MHPDRSIEIGHSVKVPREVLLPIADLFPFPIPLLVEDDAFNGSVQDDITFVHCSRMTFHQLLSFRVFGACVTYLSARASEYTQHVRVRVGRPLLLEERRIAFYAHMYASRIEPPIILFACCLVVSREASKNPRLLYRTLRNIG
jgi:hypothetical protein